MATKITAENYKEEYEDAIVKLSVIEKRIEMRFLLLCKRHPDIALYQISDITQKTLGTDVLSGSFTSKHVAMLDTISRLKFITIIEKELANRNSLLIKDEK